MNKDEALRAITALTNLLVSDIKTMTPETSLLADKVLAAAFAVLLK